MVLGNGEGEDKPCEKLQDDLGPELGVARVRWAEPGGGTIHRVPKVLC